MIGSMFSGYGGLDLAAEALYGLDTAWHVETDPHASQVLAHHWPGTPNLGDVTAIDWASVPPVTVITAGFPCQDLSYAGLGAGIEGARSGLWTHVADAVRTLRPDRLVVENVPALLARGLGRVVGDLAEIGYDAEWGCLPAAAVGAPHRRDRIFLIAHPADTGSSGRDWRPAGNEPAVGGRDRLPAIGGESIGVATGSLGPVADADGVAGAPPVTVDRGRCQVGEPGAVTGTVGLHRPPAPHPDDLGCEGAVTRPHRDDRRSDPRPTPNTDRSRLEGIERTPVGRDAVRADLGDDADRRRMWGRYWPAIHRWEQTIGRPAPHPTTPAGRLNPELPEWMMGLPHGWVTGVVESHTGQLRCLGNGVVPLQAYHALAQLEARIAQALEAAA